MSEFIQRIVQATDDGGWEVVKPDHERASGRFGTQAEAEARAKEIVANLGGGEVVVKGRDGRIRDTDTVAPGHESSVRDTQH